MNPFVAVLLVQFHKLQILCNRPLLLVEIRINVIVPSFSALLSYAAWQEGGNLLPLFETVLSNLLPKNHVLLRSPISFDLLDCAILSIVSQHKPSIHTLNFGFGLAIDSLLVQRNGLLFQFYELVELFMYHGNLLDLVHRDEPNQLLILFLGPLFFFLCHFVN